MFGFPSLSEMLESAWTWFLDLLTSWFCPLIQALFAALPPKLPDAAGQALQWLEIANYWTGFGDVMVDIVNYWLFVASFSAIKLVVKLIPTVG